jgi:periplasmic protein TonB
MKMNTWTIFFWVSLAHLALGAALFISPKSTVQTYLNVQPLRATVVRLQKSGDKPAAEPETQPLPEKIELAAKSKPRTSTSYKKPVIREVAAQTNAPVQAPIPMALSDLVIEHQPEPIYPTMSKRMGEEGKVIVRLLVGIRGAVERTEIIESSGIPPLDQAALDAVRQWKFSPPQNSGTVHPAWVMVPILFTLGFAL